MYSGTLYMYIWHEDKQTDNQVSYGKTWDHLLLLLLLTEVFLTHKIVSVQTIISAFTDARTHTRTHAHTHTHTHARARARAHTHTRTHAHTHAHIHTHTRARTYVACLLVTDVDWELIDRLTGVSNDALNPEQ